MNILPINPDAKENLRLLLEEIVGQSGLKHATLHWLAQQDSPHIYAKYMCSHLRPFVKKACFGTFNDMGNFIREMYGHLYKCVDTVRNIWYEFKGHRWYAMESIYNLHDKIFEGISSINYEDELEQIMIIKFCNKFKSLSFMEQVVKMCAHKFYDEKFLNRLDSDPHLIGCNNGIIDMQSGRPNFRPGTPDDYVSMSVGFDYEPNCDMEIVNQISQIFKRVFIWENIMSLLNSHKNQNKFMIWHQIDPAIVNLICYALGDYASILPSSIITRNPNPELLCTKGKRFLVISELGDDETIYIPFAKRLVSGNSIIGKPLYGSSICFKSQCKVVLPCELKCPTMSGPDCGSNDWYRVIPCGGGECGIKKEWRSTFLWMLINHPVNQNENVELEEVMKYTEKHKRDRDVIAKFLDERIVGTKAETDDNYNTEPINKIFVAFKSWCKENDFELVISKPEFVAYLVKNGYTVTKHVVRGIMLLEE